MRMLEAAFRGYLRTALPSVAAGACLLLSPPTAPAQITLEPYLGAYWFDDDALDFAFQRAEFDAGQILGARALFPLGGGLSVGGGYGFASFTVTLTAPTVIDPEGVSLEDDVSEHLYYGTVEYAPRPPDPVGVFVAGELGGATYSPGSGDSTSDLLAGFGGGLDIKTSNRVAIRVGGRDHLRFCSEAVFAPPAGGSRASARRTRCSTTSSCRQVLASGSDHGGLAEPRGGSSNRQMPICSTPGPSMRVVRPAP